MNCQVASWEEERDGLHSPGPSGIPNPHTLDRQKGILVLFLFSFLSLLGRITDLSPCVCLAFVSPIFWSVFSCILLIFLSMGLWYFSYQFLGALYIIRSQHCCNCYKRFLPFLHHVGFGYDFAYRNVISGIRLWALYPSCLYKGAGATFGPSFLLVNSEVSSKFRANLGQGKHSA